MPIRFLLTLALLFICTTASQAQTTAFTYQGIFADNGNLVTGNYDFQFKLYAADAGGTPLGSQTKLNILVTNGIFTVQVDFGACLACFDGSARFLEIAVKPTSGSTFTTLSPRQPITSTPYAIKTQNLTFNGPFNDGSMIFDTTNTFAGEGTGVNTTPDPILSSPDGKFNTFYGAGAGKANTTGFENVFFGYRAGTSNTTGVSNTFIGDIAGVSNTTGHQNTFIGSGTNFTGANPTGQNNTLLGFDTHVNSGVSNATAIGANAQVTQSNSLILGSTSSPGTSVGIGTTAPTERLHVVGNGLFTGNLTVNGTFTATGSIAASSLTGVVATANGGTGLSASGATGSYLRSNCTTWTSSSLQTGDLIGTLGTANGGTGLSATGATGNYLRSNGTSWTSAAIQPADLPTGSGNYIQNGASQQASFNISGNGTLGGTLSAAIVDTSGPYRISGLRVLAVSGPDTGFTASNTFVGESAGLNTAPDPINPGGTAVFNSFFGANAGKANMTGAYNAFFGARAGESNLAGGGNSFFGQGAGQSNTSANNAFFGARAGVFSTSGGSNSFFGTSAGESNDTRSDNTFVGFNAGKANTGNNNTLVGANSSVAASSLTFATAIGANATVAQSNSLVLGSINGINGATADTNVGIGTTAPSARLHVLGNVILAGSLQAGSITTSGNVGIGSFISPQARLDVAGTVRVQTLVSGFSQDVCVDFNNVLSNCSSSIRYKENINGFTEGLDLIGRLRPVTFSWKQNGARDMGLVAEEVAAVEPLLVTHNDKGEIEGVKYDRVGVVLINAIKEQQQQIEAQRKQIEAQQKLIEDLRILACKGNPQARLCK